MAYRRRIDGPPLEVEPSTAGASGGGDLGQEWVAGLNEFMGALYQWRAATQTTVDAVQRVEAAIVRLEGIYRRANVKSAQN